MSTTAAHRNFEIIARKHREDWAETPAQVRALAEAAAATALRLAVLSDKAKEAKECRLIALELSVRVIELAEREARAAKLASMTGQELLDYLNKCFQEDGLFDIADNEAETVAEALEKAREHIQWYRDHTLEMARAMEDDLADVVDLLGLEVD